MVVFFLVFFSYSNFYFFKFTKINILLLSYLRAGGSFKKLSDVEVKETLESGMCDVIKIRLKRRDATTIGKGKQPLNIKTAVDWLILKLGLPNFR